MTCQFFGKLLDGKISGAALTAENTAPFTESSIPVRAGKTSIESNFKYFLAKTLFQMVVQRIVRLSVPLVQGFPIA